MKDMNMTEGNFWKKILIFTIPIMLSSILQLLFNTVDMIVIGQFAGDASLAAVGSTSALINLIVNLFIGVSIGANVVVSRAVAALPVLAEYTIPFLKEGGHLISYKTPEAEKEVGEAANAIRVLGGAKPHIYNLTLPDSDITRSFIVIKKTHATPKAYPRKAGTAKKNPL